MRIAADALPALASAAAQLHDPFPAEFDLSQLLPENGGDGSPGFVMQGTQTTLGLAKTQPTSAT